MNTLITKSSSLLKRGSAPKAFRNKKHGYKLWKEGYVPGVFVKPKYKAVKTLYFVKASVHAICDALVTHIDVIYKKLFY